ncbi:NUDIX hydrolase [Siculibacillus lacustris]|uniref:NUDIX hydrolase n=1 Tax=Siculibacillus lacustris TaxID=1549641 RepID=A0A4Q9VLC8_9HYPH|nr:NUDIX hydrolase [Siculibacillus lacustris]TBW35384.1 NUDIX hydrolase [Siculibacillus lacustris]
MTSILAAPVSVAAVDLTVDAVPLSATDAERAAVAAHFAAATAANPKIWNGPFYLFERAGPVTAAGFSAHARRTDFATFLHWRAAPDARFTHIFPVAAVTTADDRLLVGVMGAATANPGKIYPPSGSFDPDDETDGRLDPVANMVRELAEEVGLDVAGLTPDPGFVLYPAGPCRIAIVRRFRAPAPSAAYAPAIAAHVAADPHQELAAFRFLGFDERIAPTATVGYVDALLADLATRRI